MKKAYIGIDIGGTNIKVGLFDSQMSLLCKTSVPTQGDMGPADVVERIAQAAMDLLDQAELGIEQIQAIGIGTPGPADYPNGIVTAAANLPKFRDTPLRDMISEQLGNRPAVLENDATVACWGEFAMGAGKEIEDMVFFTLGTGVLHIQPKATLVQVEDRTDQQAHVGFGLRTHLGRRFMLRAEYKSYVVFTSRDENEEVEEWKAGFAVFF